MTKPRLIVLDGEWDSPAIDEAGRRVARMIRGRKPPLFVRPGKYDFPVGGAVDLDPPQKWVETAQKIGKTLEQGRDVVLVANISHGPGHQWSEQLAKTAGADLFARRLVLGGKAKEDPEPDHPVRAQNWLATERGAGLATDIARDLQREFPREGALTPDHVPAEPDVATVIIDNKDKRKELARAIGERETVALFDVDARADEIRNSPAMANMPEIPEKYNLIHAAVWRDVADEVAKAMRSGKDCILLSRMAVSDSPQAETVMKPVYNVADGTRRTLRLTGPGSTLQEGEEEIEWPEAETAAEAATQLAIQLTEREPEPSLEDLLDMPFVADRRRKISGPAI
ncbi:MAG: hypothetical protein Alpg2KO_25360 [Alphaproteobacteria bacterium]